MGETKMTNYERHAAMKRDWANHHPNATPQEYELAMRLIANLCGF